MRTPVRLPDGIPISGGWIESSSISHSTGHRTYEALAELGGVGGLFDCEPLGLAGEDLAEVGDVAYSGRWLWCCAWSG